MTRCLFYDKRLWSNSIYLVCDHGVRGNISDCDSEVAGSIPVDHLFVSICLLKVFNLYDL